MSSYAEHWRRHTKFKTRVATGKSMDERWKRVKAELQDKLKQQAEEESK